MAMEKRAADTSADMEKSAAYAKFYKMIEADRGPQFEKMAAQRVNIPDEEPEMVDLFSHPDFLARVNENLQKHASWLPTFMQAVEKTAAKIVKKKKSKKGRC